MTTRRYTVACLAGDGIGPELMGEASRALTAVSHLLGFHLDELHVPFGGEAFSRSGYALPAPTRTACLGADAVLAGARRPALVTLESELDLRASITRVRSSRRGDLVLLSPLVAGAERWTVERAFAVARSRRAEITFVDADHGWREIVDTVAEAHDGVLVEHLSVAAALPALAFERERLDVVVTGQLLGDTFAAVAAAPDRQPRAVASGRLAQHGPSIFVPSHGAAHDIAGQGVANPSSMLLAASLMLGEGLGERAAAETLADALAGALGNGARTADLVHAGVAATTREFADVVLAELPASWANAEFYREAVAS